MLIDNEISREDFTTINKEVRNYCDLKESIRITKSQKMDIERNKLMIKQKALMKSLNKMKKINNNLKSKV